MGKLENWIIDNQMHSSAEVLADLIGAEMHERCNEFPPHPDTLEWHNATFERRFKNALLGLPPPDSAMVAMLCKVLDMEIDHEVEELDRFIKDGGLTSVCPTAAHHETFHFLWQSLLHHLEERSSSLEVPFKRKDKHRVVESLRKRALMVHLAS
ncbi:MAG: hypothetical protein AB2A00_34720 [Myxococcota bacterium]